MYTNRSRKYKSGHKHSYAKRSYFKNNQTMIDIMNEYQDLYPTTKIKINRNLKARVAYVTSWYFYENTKQSGNNWKDNTKKKHQYLRHTK